MQIQIMYYIILCLFFSSSIGAMQQDNKSFVEIQGYDGNDKYLQIPVEHCYDVAAFELICQSNNHQYTFENISHDTLEIIAQNLSRKYLNQEYILPKEDLCKLNNIIIASDFLGFSDLYEQCRNTLDSKKNKIFAWLTCSYSLITTLYDLLPNNVSCCCLIPSSNLQMPHLLACGTSNSTISNDIHLFDLLRQVKYNVLNQNNLSGTLSNKSCSMCPMITYDNKNIYNSYLATANINDKYHSYKHEEIIHIWDLQTEELVKTFTINNSSKSCFYPMHSIPNSPYLVLRINNSLQILDILSGTTIKTFDMNNQNDSITSFCLIPASHNKYNFAIAFSDGTIRIFNPESEVFTEIVYKQKYGAQLMCTIPDPFNNNKYYLTTNCKNDESFIINIWNSETNKLLCPLQTNEEDAPIIWLGIMPSPKNDKFFYLAAALKNGSIKFWDISKILELAEVFSYCNLEQLTFLNIVQMHAKEEQKLCLSNSENSFWSIEKSSLELYTNLPKNIKNHISKFCYVMDW